MKLALQVIAYDVNRYINAMLRNAAPWVDKIFIAYPSRPWVYIPESRNSRTNLTTLADIDTEGLPCAVEIVNGDWEREEDTRNACHDAARNQGFDWMVVQDADEFYTTESWEQLRRILLANPAEDGFKTTWYQFWKSSEYVLLNSDGSLKDRNALFALRITKESCFVRSRSANVRNLRTVDVPCYHYGWVKSDDEMLAKVTQWGHADQIDGHRWFRLKWLYWEIETRNLWPHNPTACPRAIRFPLHQPEFAHQFALPLYPEPQALPIRLENIVYDRRAELLDFLRSWKRSIFPRAHLKKIGVHLPEKVAPTMPQKK